MKKGEFYDIRSTCIARNGERCKDCIFYGKVCNNWKKEHRNRKPCDYDPFKNDIMSKYPGLVQVYNKNAKLTQRKGDQRNGIIKEKRNRDKRSRNQG